jgi:hypothetical protein
MNSMIFGTHCTAVYQNIIATRVRLFPHWPVQSVLYLGSSPLASRHSTSTELAAPSPPLPSTYIPSQPIQQPWQSPQQFQRPCPWPCTTSDRPETPLPQSRSGEIVPNLGSGISKCSIQVISGETEAVSRPNTYSPSSIFGPSRGFSPMRSCF